MQIFRTINIYEVACESKFMKLEDLHKKIQSQILRQFEPSDTPEHWPHCYPRQLTDYFSNLGNTFD